MKVLNFLGGPGAGKSTTAAGVFYSMKIEGYSVELVTEYAKALVWQERYRTLLDQQYVFAKQNARLNTLKGKVDYVITDSPLLFGLVYNPETYHPAFTDFVKEVWESYDNDTYLINRSGIPYDSVGRTQTKEEAQNIDSKVINVLDTLEVPYHVLKGPPNTRVTQVMNTLRRKEYANG